MNDVSQNASGRSHELAAVMMIQKRERATTWGEDNTRTRVGEKAGGVSLSIRALRCAPGKSLIRGEREKLADGLGEQSIAQKEKKGEGANLG